MKTKDEILDGMTEEEKFKFDLCGVKLIGTLHNWVTFTGHNDVKYYLGEVYSSPDNISTYSDGSTTYPVDQYPILSEFDFNGETAVKTKVFYTQGGPTLWVILGEPGTPEHETKFRSIQHAKLY